MYIFLERISCVLYNDLSEINMVYIKVVNCHLSTRNGMRDENRHSIFENSVPLQAKFYQEHKQA